MKICSICHEEKDFSAFFKRKLSKDGVHFWCRSCDSKTRKKKYAEDIEYRNKVRKQSRESKERRKANDPEYSVKMRIYRKEIYDNNPEHRAKTLKRNKENTKKRRKTDPLYKLSLNLKALISLSIRNKGYTKASRTHFLLGTDFKTVQDHLISSAINNYGFYDPNLSYHIDHIIPCASAKNEEELIKLQHYTNLQYLYPEDNLKKGSKNVR